MRFFVLTNNPLVRDKTAPGTEVVYKPVALMQVFEEAACYIAKGHRLLTHPLSGSVKPGETPYKSMIVSADAAETVDAESARLVSSAMDACGKFADRAGMHDEATLRDLQTVDFSLIEGALRSARMQC